MNLCILNIFSGLVLCFESLLYKNLVLKDLVKTREEDKVSIGAWIYLWAFYSVPLKIDNF